MSQITTITLFKYRGFWSKIWAFGMMQFAHSPLKKVDGLQFYKLWGSGKENFNPLPDWSVYALLQIWDKEESARTFFSSSELFSIYHRRTEEHWTLYLKSIISRGAWSGGNPFRKSTDLDAENPFIVAITRATIKFRLLYRFWKYVPHSQGNLGTNKGLIYTKGFGEVPIKHMATSVFGGIKNPWTNLLTRTNLMLGPLEIHEPWIGIKRSCSLDFNHIVHKEHGMEKIHCPI